MRKTPNLDLPIYDKPSTDTFKVADWNKANENIDYVFGELKKNPNVNAIDIKAREDIINNHKEVTEQLDDIETDINKKELLFKGSYESLKDLLENCEDVTERGGVIYLPSGIFEVAPFYIGTRIKIKGSGIGATILRYKANSEDDFITIGKSDVFCSIEDLTIDGNKINKTRGNCITVKEIDTWDRHDAELVLKKEEKKEETNAYFFMNNVMILNAPSNGIYLEQKRYAINLNNIYVNFANGNGIHNKSTDNFFNNIWCNHCGHSGILEEGKNNKWTNGKIIWNCRDNDNVAGVQINGHNNTFNSYESQDNYGHGFKITGGGNVLANALSDANGYKTYDISSDKHYGYFIENAYNNAIVNSVVANYREKPFMKKPYVIIGHSNKIDIKVLPNSCIDMKSEIGSANSGTMNLSNVERMFYIDNMGISHILMNCYFEITNTSPVTQTFDLPIDFATTLSCISEVLSINTGGITGQSYKIPHHAEIIDVGGIKKLKVTTKSDNSIAGVWAINIHVRIEGY